jgi:ATP-dependent RNA helicase HelY
MTKSGADDRAKSGADDRATGELARFTAELEFELDDFQRRACAALESGHGVLVCAPTGAG